MTKYEDKNGYVSNYQIAKYMKENGVSEVKDPESALYLTTDGKMWGSTDPYGIRDLDHNVVSGLITEGKNMYRTNNGVQNFYAALHSKTGLVRLVPETNEALIATDQHLTSAQNKTLQKSNYQIDKYVESISSNDFLKPEIKLRTNKEKIEKNNEKEEIEIDVEKKEEAIKDAHMRLALKRLNQTNNLGMVVLGREESSPGKTTYIQYASPQDAKNKSGDYAVFEIDNSKILKRKNLNEQVEEIKPIIVDQSKALYEKGINSKKLLDKAHSNFRNLNNDPNKEIEIQKHDNYIEMQKEDAVRYLNKKLNNNQLSLRIRPATSASVEKDITVEDANGNEKYPDITVLYESKKFPIYKGFKYYDFNQIKKDIPKPLRNDQNAINQQLAYQFAKDVQKEPNLENERKSLDPQNALKSEADKEVKRKAGAIIKDISKEIKQNHKLQQSKIKSHFKKKNVKQLTKEEQYQQYIQSQNMNME